MIFRMRWGMVLIGGLLVVSGCATKRAAAQAPTGNEPPPRGAPGANQGNLPPPSPMHQGELEDSQNRFPITEGQLRKERKQRAQAAATTRVEVKGNDNTVHACDGLTAEEKTECPLHDPAAVVSITDLPTGARVSLRPGKVPPERLQQMFACHKTLAVARPKAPTACTFFDARTEVDVVVHEKTIDVDLERKADADVLREQVRTALRKR